VLQSSASQGLAVSNAIVANMLTILSTYFNFSIKPMSLSNSLFPDPTNAGVHQSEETVTADVIKSRNHIAA
jgi:hypothetical protein